MRAGTLLVALLSCLLAVVFSAAPASAGEVKGYNSSLTGNGKCQKTPMDGDCYHYAGTYTTHTKCYDAMAKILHQNPKTARGKYNISLASYGCFAEPPAGHYQLYVYQSAPACKVGLVFSKCPKG